MTRNARLTRRATQVTAAVIMTALVVAGCGKINLKKEADAARSSLSSARSASFTLHVSDPRGELSTSSTDKKAAKAATDAAVSVTIDPAGDGRVGAMTAPTKTSDPAAALKASGSFELVYRNAGHPVVSLRSIAGVIYLRIDPAQYEAVAGQPLPLNDLTGGGIIPGTAPALAGIKAGKWLSLDLPAVYAKAKASGLVGAGSGTAGPTVDPRKLQALEKAVTQAVTGHSSYTSTKAGGVTTLAYKVDARAALRAVVDVLGDPAYAGLLGATGPTAAKSLADAKVALAQLPAGSVTGTMTLAKGHFRQVTLNLGSVAALSKKPTATKVKTARLIVDIDDTAPAVVAPPQDQVVPLDSLAAALLSLAGSAADSGTPQTTN